MGRLPKVLLQHEVTFTPLLGTGPYGEVWGDPVTVRGFLDEGTRLVRDPGGGEVTSSSTFYCQLDAFDPLLKTGSKADLPGDRTTTVIAALRRDGRRLPVPSHLEIQLE